MKFKFGLLILTLLLFQYTKLNGLNLIVNFKEDSIHLDQSNINYIYNRALDIIMKHPKIFLEDSEKPLFNPKKDSVFISPIIKNDEVFSPLLRDSLYTAPLLKLEVQTFFDQVMFYSNLNIKKILYYKNYQNKNDPNITIYFTNLFQFKQRLFLGALVFWNNVNKFESGNQIRLIIELDICNNEYVFFRKLYSNINIELNEPDVKLVPDTNFSIKNNGEYFKTIKSPYREYPRTTFYEFNLGDKNCNE